MCNCSERGKLISAEEQFTPIRLQQDFDTSWKNLLHTLSRIFNITEWFVERKASQKKKIAEKKLKTTTGKATYVANRVSIPSISLVYI